MYNMHLFYTTRYKLVHTCKLLYLASLSPAAGRFADPATAAPRRLQDGGGSGDESGGRIAAGRRSWVAGEASWRWSCSRVVRTAN